MTAPTAALDETHDPARRSWVAAANAPGAAFPIQNLPFCVFRRNGHDGPGRMGVGIGDRILDLAAAAQAGLLGEDAALAAEPTLNRLMAAGRPAWRRLRRTLSALLADNVDAALQRRAEPLLMPMAEASFLLPATIGDYTDFYASAVHATNTGSLLRPDTPLLPNYKWIPVGYHGRSSSIFVSGAPVVRPHGQLKPRGADVPFFAASRRLDLEAELGVFVGPGNRPGEPIPIAAAADHLFGVTLLNDWSARDVQAWEYQPLGPFLAKNFATTISPWVVTLEALAPFRIPALARPLGDPAPLPYLDDPADRAMGGFDIRVTLALETAAMRTAGEAPHPLSTVAFEDMYWTLAQLLAHHSSGGCNLCPGDLLGSGTISSPAPGGVGSLLEMTRGGKAPIALPNGETRTFLEDGDAVVLTATASRDGAVPIGFGECRGEILPSPAAA